MQQGSQKLSCMNYKSINHHNHITKIQNNNDDIHLIKKLLTKKHWYLMARQVFGIGDEYMYASENIFSNSDYKS